jgi:hypothetical protein
MPLPRITAPNQYTPQQATEYNDLYMTDLRISADPAGAWPAIITLRNSNYDLDILAQASPATIHKMRIEDLRVDAARSPVVAQTLGGVLYVVDLLFREKRALAELKTANLILLAKTNASTKAAADHTQAVGLLESLENSLLDAENNLDNILFDQEYNPEYLENAELQIEQLQTTISTLLYRISDAEIDLESKLTAKNTANNELSTAQASVDAINATLAAIRAGLQIS